MMLEANLELGYRDVQEILAISACMIDPASTSWTSNGAAKKTTTKRATTAK